MTRVAVALSGGVDSAVAALLLRDQGFEVVGVTMRVWAGDAGAPPGGGRGSCYGPGEAEDLASAARVAARLGIPHHVVDLREEYRRHVLEYFQSEYTRGRTPNPCVRCNGLVKFGLLAERARDVAACGLLATGHYARTDLDPATGRRRLLRGRDRAKDQSYFLFRLDQEQLARTLLPLGERTKEEVRRLAAGLGLGLESRPESQDFAGRGAAGLLGAVGGGPGPVLDTGGRVLSRHRGIHLYTVGQRKGLGLARPEPLYVLRIDAAANALIVGPRAETLSPGLVAGELSWVSIPPPAAPFRAAVQIRRGHTAAPAEIAPAGGGTAAVRFDEPQAAVAPGQAAVFYAGDLLLGGGTIA